MNLSVGRISMSVDVRRIVEQTPGSDVDPREIFGQWPVGTASRIDAGDLRVGDEKCEEVRNSSPQINTRSALLLSTL